MPSRRRKSELEEFVDIFDQLPVRAGIITAATFFLVGWLLPILFPVRGLDLVGVFAVPARLFLWMLALLVLLASLFGVMRRSRESARFDSTVDVNSLTWTQFEGYLAEYFRRAGATVTSRGGMQADGGVDLVVEDTRGRRIVQAKHWRQRQVSVERLRALWGVRDDEHAVGAIFVTSGSFTRDAIAFASGKDFELIDGPRLRTLVASVARSTFGVTTAQVETCPKCNAGRVERKLARRGRNAGGYFLGCNRYPSCDYARNA